MEAILFAAARSDHVSEVIVPALRSGTNVLCDRFVDSSRAYQRRAATIMPHLQRAALDGLVPDLTLIFDLDPAVGRERVRQRDGGLDRFEASELEELNERRRIFLAIAEREAHRCAVIDADGTMDEVEHRMLTEVTSRLPALLTESGGARRIHG